MYRKVASFEQFFTATGNFSDRLKTNGTGFVGGDIQIRDGASSSELELEKRKCKIAIRVELDALSSIKNQLQEASAQKIKTGEYADPDWWRRANGAKRHHGIRHQALEQTLAEINRRLKGARHHERQAEMIECLEKATIELQGEKVWRLIKIRAIELQERLDRERAN